jgi:hypothetical protein
MMEEVLSSGFDDDPFLIMTSLRLEGSLLQEAGFIGSDMTLAKSNLGAESPGGLRNRTNRM